MFSLCQHSQPEGRTHYKDNTPHTCRLTWSAAQSGARPRWMFPGCSRVRTLCFLRDWKQTDVHQTEVHRTNNHLSGAFCMAHTTTDTLKYEENDEQHFKKVPYGHTRAPAFKYICLLLLFYDQMQGTSTKMMTILQQKVLKSVKLKWCVLNASSKESSCLTYSRLYIVQNHPAISLR